MGEETQSKVCLDIAIDHRIRALCKPVTISPREPSPHISHLWNLGKSLGRPNSEIQVTTELAGPAVKGGIAVTLQRPRNNHPFEEGIEEVIEDCDTLLALYDVFRVVSCESLDIRHDISIIDLLPYMSNEQTDVDADLKKFFNVSAQVICDMEPDVLLCAGKIWHSDWKRFNRIKGEARNLECIGVGRMFGQALNMPVQTSIRGKDGGLVFIKRVNGFHPSYAMNYWAHVSLLRQLLVLVCAEACGTLRNDWENKAWMNKLRSQCQELSESHIEKSQPRDIPDYKTLYVDTLTDLEHTAIYLLLKSELGQSRRADYEAILSSNLSKICNNASLILRRMNHLLEQGWPKSSALRNKGALETSAEHTDETMQDLLKAAKQAGDQKLSEIIQQGANSILGYVSAEGLQLEKASDAFLELATNIETLLFDLSALLENESTYDFAEQTEDLSSMMGNLTLGVGPNLVK